MVNKSCVYKLGNLFFSW